MLVVVELYTVEIVDQVSYIEGRIIKGNDIAFRSGDYRKATSASHSPTTGVKDIQVGNIVWAEFAPTVPYMGCFR